MGWQRRARTLSASSTLSSSGLRFVDGIASMTPRTCSNRQGKSDRNTVHSLLQPAMSHGAR